MQVLKRIAHAESLQVTQLHCKPATAPDSSTLAVGSASGAVLLVDAKSGTVYSKALQHAAPVTATAWNARSEDGVVALASCDRAGCVLFWQAVEAS